jgi:cytochrome c553
MRLMLHHSRGSWLAALLLPTLLLLPLLAKAQAVPLAERLTLCAGCHNADGNSTIPDNPKLASLDPEYIIKQLTDFKAGNRSNVLMSSIIPLVDAKEFEALAAYFHDQKRQLGAPFDPKLAAIGKEIFDEGIVATAVPACAGCHNEDGSGTAKYPRIAGQHSAYVIRQLTNFKSGERTNDPKGVMRAVAKRLTEDNMRAVAEYIVTLKGGQE